LLSALHSTALSLLLLSFVSVSAQTTGTRSIPYSATKKTTLIQKLADGTTITHESTATEARDSEGRTVQTNTMTGFGGRNITHSMVMDPVARTITNWSNATKEATTMHMPELRKVSQPGPVIMGVGSSMLSAVVEAGDSPIAIGPS
jgi:hypothetical protein